MAVKVRSQFRASGIYGGKKMIFRWGSSVPQAAIENIFSLYGQFREVSDLRRSKDDYMHTKIKIKVLKTKFIEPVQCHIFKISKVV
jgi:hypothetical protein